MEEDSVVQADGLVASSAEATEEGADDLGDGKIGLIAVSHE